MKRLLNIPKNTFRALQRAIYGRNDLSVIVNQADPEASLFDQVRWLETLMDWVRSASRLPHDFDRSTGQLHWVRIKFLLQFLERNPEWKRNVGGSLKSILDQTSGVELFCRTGLTQERGLASEILDRGLKKILPSPPLERSLDDLFPRLFRSFNDAIWVENLPADVYEGFVALLSAAGRPDESGGLRESMLDAVLVLAEEVAARGISSDMRSRLPFPSIRHSPFLLLRKKLDKKVEDLQNKPNRASEDIAADLESCFGAIERIYQQLDREGVSVSLVYNLEAQKAALKRIETLLGILSNNPDSANHRHITRFLGDLIRESLGARHIRPLLGTNLRLLSQKIVERAGASGEHYITRTRQEYRRMFKAGLGGGAITVLTTVLKYLITAAKLPLFFEGFFSSVNYGASFSIIQISGFTLATKQPAMTGPALAGKLRHLRGTRDIKAFVEEVAKLTRSQFAAAFGNVIAAFPCAILFDLIYFQLTHTHTLSTAKAAYSVHSVNPFLSLTIPFAIWTGILLWSSGIVAGWVENWVVYRRLPDAIAHHRILRVAFGERRCEKASHWFLHNIGGLSSSVALGTMMGFTPIFGIFFGLPLEVRHVTLSTASLGLAAASTFGPRFDYWGFAYAFVGVCVIMLLNLGVSLAIAFTIACRAREVRSRSIFLLIRSTAQSFRKRPLSFFFHPTKTPETLD